MKQTCSDLLNQLKPSIQPQVEKLEFIGVEGYDVYNITAPFPNKNQDIIAGRVEKRDSEQSTVCFFAQNDQQQWELQPQLPTFQLQDPFVTFIHGELIFGGVQVYPHPENPESLAWRTVFYCGNSIETLEEFFIGPDGMKDIRLVEVTPNQILVFTRPQGVVGGRGKIGTTSIQTLAELTHEVIESATLLDQFIEEEWGGVNAAYPLANGKIGILGHIASFDEKENRHYYSITFCYDPKAKEFSAMKLLATRSMFLPGPTKRLDLEDVVFSGGLRFSEDEQEVELYVGISDSHAQKINLANPFL
ncbi:DUF1861 family protein [Carnobacterium maltaromaticum]|uniref:DUF1861 family protein n=1 Tax=Carnobacterium maltaromaticum TaxID=2751 RepID=UPI00295EAB7A|nr:DUF1861 family protein [Carnobacterium maltaromaticum]